MDGIVVVVIACTRPHELQTDKKQHKQEKMDSKYDP